MKRTPHPLLSLLLSSTFFVTATFAQEGERPRPPAGPGPEGRGNPAEMLKRADSDGDGKVSKDEFMKARTAELNDLFGRIDANSDGFIDTTEAEQMAERMRMGMGRPGPGGPPPEGMRRPDGEGRGRPEGDGFRRPPEGEGMRRPEGEGRGRPEGEGRGRPEGEGRGRPEAAGGQLSDQAFSRMDQNGDGQLSKSEFDQGMARMREMMARGGMGRGEGRGPGGPPAEGGFRRPPSTGPKEEAKPREAKPEASPEGKAEAPKKEGV